MLNVIIFVLVKCKMEAQTSHVSDKKRGMEGRLKHTFIAQADPPIYFCWKTRTYSVKTNAPCDTLPLHKPVQFTIT